jgi:hypothetical protein
MAEQQSEIEVSRGREIFRLLHAAREHDGDALITEALAGRERNVKNITALMNFATKNFGQEGSTTVDKLWKSCEPLLREAGLAAKQLDAVRHPYKVYGQPGFKSVLEEFEA